MRRQRTLPEEKMDFKTRSSKEHRGQSKFSLFGDGLQGIKPVLTLAVAAGPARLSQTTLSLILTISVKTCRLVETRRKILRFVETRHHILSRARISAKNAAAEHLGSNFD